MVIRLCTLRSGLDPEGVCEGIISGRYTWSVVCSPQTQMDLVTNGLPDLEEGHMS